MKIILLENVQGHGKKGDIVDVNDGYAKNFLIPKKKAVEATKAVLNEYNQKLAKEERIAREEKEAAIALAKQLEGKKVTVTVKSGGGKIYGSVTNQDVANGLAEAGFTIDKKKIVIKETIKNPGLYEAEVKVYKEMSVKIKIEVVAVNV